MTKKFECAQCGNCCRQNGDLRLISEDLEKISSYLGLTIEEFIEKYEITNIEQKLFFIDTHGCCPFLTEDSKCMLQAAKPFFCANYIPFIDNEGSLIYQICKGLGTGREWTWDEIDSVYNKMFEKLVIRHNGGNV